VSADDRFHDAARYGSGLVAVGNRRSSGTAKYRPWVVFLNAAGSVAGLGQRVADVALKQRWPLVLGIRETPMSPILLENLLRLARTGAHVVPPLPAFYLRPDPAGAWETFLDHYCLRVLDLLGLATVPEELRWRG